MITICAPRALLEQYLAMARRSKLDVVGVNIEPCAIVDCFSHRFRQAPNSAKTILYLDLGSCSTQVVLSHDNRIVFARNLSTGGRQLDEAVAKGMKISIEEANMMRRKLIAGEGNASAAEEVYKLLDAPLDTLTDRLTQCLRYYESVFRNQNVDRVIFVGGQAYDKRLCQAIAQRLNLPAQIGDPLLGIRRIPGAGSDTELNQSCPQPNWAVAVGLSLGAAKVA